jgi:monoamine oxidase
LLQALGPAADPRRRLTRRQAFLAGLSCGYLEGAVRSGERAANGVLAAL